MSPASLMLISLFRNQQRVISLGNNDLSVTRSRPLITHHLRYFLTKPRREEQKVPRCSVSAGEVCREHGGKSHTQTGASSQHSLPPHPSSHQTGFPNGQNLTFWVGKKRMTRRTKSPILSLFRYFRVKINCFFS